MASTDTKNAVRPATGTYTIDPGHSGVSFTGRHLMISKVRGKFAVDSGSLVIADDPEQSSVEATVNVASVESGDAKRDEHLRSSDFFDAERFPEITFESEGIQLNGDGRRFVIPGALTIKDVTRPIALGGNFRGSGVHPDGGERIAFGLWAHLDRTDFGLVWNRALETGGMLVGNTVELAVDVSAIRVD